MKTQTFVANKVSSSCPWKPPYAPYLPCLLSGSLRLFLITPHSKGALVVPYSIPALILFVLVLTVLILSWLGHYQMYWPLPLKFCLHSCVQTCLLIWADALDSDSAPPAYRPTHTPSPSPPPSPSPSPSPSHPFPHPLTLGPCLHPLILACTSLTIISEHQGFANPCGYEPWVTTGTGRVCISTVFANPYLHSGSQVYCRITHRYTVPIYTSYSTVTGTKMLGQMRPVHTPSIEP